MKQLHRVHRISLQTMHDRLGNPESKDRVDVVHTPSGRMAADIFTKAFDSKEKWDAAIFNINVIDLDRLDAHIIQKHDIFEELDRVVVALLEVVLRHSPMLNHSDMMN